MLTPQNFPSAYEKERVSTLKKYNSLYEGYHFQVLGLHELLKKQFLKTQDLIYLAHNLPAYISDFYGDFVAGDTEKMIIRANVENPDVVKFVDEVVYENDLKEKISDIGTEQSEFGFVPLLGYLDEEGVYRIQKVAQDQYFPQADGSVVFATYKEVQIDATNSVTYCMTQHYFLESGKTKIQRQAWVCESNGTLKEKANFVDVATLIGRPSIQEEEILDIDELPIRQIDNARTSKSGYGKSDYNDIIPQVAEINERSSHISIQLLKNLDAKMMLPAAMFEEDGSVKAGFDSISMEKDDPEAKYIVNPNALLEDARQHILGQIKIVSTLTAVPMWELTKGAMPERVESLRIQLFSTSRRTARKRAKLKRALNDMFRIGFKMKGIDFNEDIEIEFSDVMPTDELTQATTEETKIRAGLSSKRSAIMRIENVDQADADEELKQIAEEEKIAGASFGGGFNQ